MPVKSFTVSRINFKLPPHDKATHLGSVVVSHGRCRFKNFSQIGNRFIFIGLFIISFSSFVFAESFCQAVIPFDMPDPTAIEASDGKGVYVFATGHGIQIPFSENLLDWERKGTVFSKTRFPNGFPDWVKTAIPGAKGIWAPDIVQLNDRYYVYYSVSTFGSQRSIIGLASNTTLDSSSVDYEWKDEGIVLESHPDHTDYNAIDSALFIDNDGKTYLFWGSHWTGLKAVEVDPKTGKPFRYSEGEWKVPANYLAVASRPDTSIEAPYVIRRGDFYYLFTSRGACCDRVKSSYHLVVGRSTKPLGPYVDREGKRMDEGGGSPFLSSTKKWKGTGHNGIFRTTDSKGDNIDWLILAAYDAQDAEKGRLTQIRPLLWDENDWPQPGDVLDTSLENFYEKQP